jgi:hypothetical protein
VLQLCDLPKMPPHGHPPWPIDVVVVVAV